MVIGVPEFSRPLTEIFCMEMTPGNGGQTNGHWVHNRINFHLEEKIRKNWTLEEKIRKKLAVRRKNQKKLAVRRENH